MNDVNLIGRIATEIKQNSGSVSSLLAVHRIYKSKDNVDADFIPLTLFGNNADNFIKFVKKGQQIGVSGALKTGEYVDSEGQKRYSWSVVVNHFYLLSNAQHDHQQQPVQSQQQPYQSPNNQYQQPQQSYQQPAPQQQSSIVLPESDKQQSEQWKILSKQLDTIEKEQQQQHQPYQPQQHQQQPRPQQTQQPYRAPQQSQQQQGGIPFD